MTLTNKMQDVINRINKIGYEKRCYDFTWFDVFRFDNVDNVEILTIEIYQNMGRDNFGWDLYNIKISNELLFLLNFDLTNSINLQQKAIELKHFIQDNGVRITGQNVDKNI